jgi:nicotinate-nucleotide adenylyltransferase
MKIGILGGSFDPVHFGHSYIAKSAIKKLKLNQVWVIPTLQNPLKNDASKSFETRFKNCQKFFKNNPKIKVKNYKNHTIYSFVLIEKIKQQNPNNHFFWIMGADSFTSLHLWKKYAKIIENIEIAVFSRQKFLRKIRQNKAFLLKKSAKIGIFRQKNCNISSSELKNNNYDN